MNFLLRTILNAHPNALEDNKIKAALVAQRSVRLHRSEAEKAEADVERLCLDWIEQGAEVSQDAED